MKIAMTGKGGVGKTTLSSMFAATIAAAGRQVVAVDADPDANLAAALGVGPADQPVPLGEMKDLIKERTGSVDGYGGYFTLNPKVDDIPERYALHLGNIRLLVLGGVLQGGGGCICPATTIVKALLTHLVLHRDGAVIMDMEAGVEHLGRATAETMDALVVVVDAGPWSLQTALRIQSLAGDIGIKRICAVANRVTPEQAGRIAGRLNGIPLIGHLPADDRLADGAVVLDGSGCPQSGPGLTAHQRAIDEMLEGIEKLAELT